MQFVHLSLQVCKGAIKNAKKKNMEKNAKKMQADAGITPGIAISIISSFLFCNANCFCFCFFSATDRFCGCLLAVKSKFLL